jgi:hypothetical protein
MSKINPIIEIYEFSTLIIWEGLQHEVNRALDKGIPGSLMDAADGGGNISINVTIQLEINYKTNRFSLIDVSNVKHMRIGEDNKSIETLGGTNTSFVFDNCTDIDFEFEYVNFMLGILRFAKDKLKEHEN